MLCSNKAKKGCENPLKYSRIQHNRHSSLKRIYMKETLQFLLLMTVLIN